MSIFPHRIRLISHHVSGTARCDRKTKRLVTRLQPGDVAVLAHHDLDEIAARELLKSRVKAVLNTQCSMTGRFPNRGPFLLLEAGIPLYDFVSVSSVGPTESIDLFQDGDAVTILDSAVYIRDQYVGECRAVTMEELIRKTVDAKTNASYELNRFLENTLHYAQQEKEFFLGPLPVPTLQTHCKGKHALVVVRGSSYLEDLQAIAHYIREQKPILIGVDGGADALLQMNLTPHLIVGDMDSVSDEALRSGAELIVHAYMDGRAPGLTRIHSLGLVAKVFQAPGTSEDVAMLVAHESGAELIVALGTHTHMVDFLEKGRKGMASTLLTRLRIGPKLVDAKGVSQLYQTRVSWKSAIIVAISALIPVAVLAAVNPVIRNILRIFYWKLKLWFG